MTYPRYVPHTTGSGKWDHNDINAVVDHVLAGETVTGYLANPYTYLVRALAGGVYDVIDATGTLVYGGAGDAGGVDGGDAAAVIQAAYDSLTSGGTLYLQAGTYALGTTKLNFDLSNTVVTGAGKAATVLTYNDTDVAVEFGDASNVLKYSSLCNLDVKLLQTNGVVGVRFNDKTYYSGMSNILIESASKPNTNIGIQLNAAADWLGYHRFYDIYCWNNLIGFQDSGAQSKTGCAWFGGLIRYGLDPAGSIAVDFNTLVSAFHMYSVATHEVETAYSIAAGCYTNCFYGSRIETVTTAFSVAGNRNNWFGGSVSSFTTGIADTGSGNRWYNIYGCSAERYGTASVLSGNATRVFAHGMSVTPTIVDISWTEDPESLWYWSADATNITLTMASGAVANDKTFHWHAIYINA